MMMVMMMMMMMMMMTMMMIMMTMMMIMITFAKKCQTVELLFYTLRQNWKFEKRQHFELREGHHIALKINFRNKRWRFRGREIRNQNIWNLLII